MLRRRQQAAATGQHKDSCSIRPWGVGPWALTLRLVEARGAYYLL